MASEMTSALDPYGAMLSLKPAPAGGSGPLAGVRLCVKDNIAVCGEPFTAGHPLYADRRGGVTASAVRRLLTAGAGFVGMTRTDAGGFGMTTPEVTNPVWPGRMVGGSSGGAAAAVAAGFADLALGTDTGGSVRVPAACTGLLGFKPSFDRVPMDGVEPLASRLDHVGLMGRDFDQLRSAAAVLLDDAAVAASAPMGRLRIAVATGLPSYADPRCLAPLQQLAGALVAAGHVVEPWTPPAAGPLVRAFGILVLAEAHPLYDRLPRPALAQLGEAAREALRFDPKVADVEAARATADAARATYGGLLARVDLLLTPTLLVPVPARGATHLELEVRRLSVLSVLLAGTCFANIIGAPALVWPASGMPGASIQAIAAHGADARLFAATAHLRTLHQYRAGEPDNIPTHV
ncbi:amidase family protein [Xanthobacter sp. ZOL 2024]